MKRQWKDDDGASLILVIIFVMVFAVVIGAVLDFAGAGFATTEKVVDIRNQQQAVDGAMDGAINSLRRTGFGTDENPCPVYEYNSVTDGDPTVFVECTIDTTAGEGDPSDAVPEYAILTGVWRDDPANVPDEPCMGFLQTGTEKMRVKGGIFSNGRIAVGEFEKDSGCSKVYPPPALSGLGEMFVSWGHAFARGKCTWWVTNQRDDPKIDTPLGTRLCNGGNNPADDGRPTVDEALPAYLPNYDTAEEVATAPAVTTIFTAGAGSKAGAGYDPLPTCSGDAEIFHPGVYTEIPTAHHDRAACPGDPDVWYFEPGTYYFDFPEDDNLWNVNPYNIIGGTLKSGLTLAGIASSWNSADHHVCDDDPYTEAAGVQFIFGGHSRLATQTVSGNGVINLCGGKSPTLSGALPDSMNQRLVVYALHSEDDHLETPGTGTDEVFESDGAIEGDFSNLPGAQNVGNGEATKQLNPSNKTGFVRFKSFADIPDGATVTSVVAEIHHSESGITAGLTRSMTFNYESNPDGTEFNITTNPKCTPNGSVDTCELDFLADELLWRDINSLTDVTYTVEGNLKQVNVDCSTPPSFKCKVDETVDVSLDTVILKVSYVEAGFEPQRADAQPFLETTSNPVALFEGTFFAPLADLAVNVHNNGTTEFLRGVIANHIEGEASPSTKQTSAPFQLPDPVIEPVVILTAKVDNKARLRVRVALEAANDLAFDSVDIQDWVYIRNS